MKQISDILNNGCHHQVQIFAWIGCLEGEQLSSLIKVLTGTWWQVATYTMDPWGAKSSERCIVSVGKLLASTFSIWAFAVFSSFAATRFLMARIFALFFAGVASTLAILAARFILAAFLGFSCKERNHNVTKVGK